jgi:hypothetical protein
MADQDDRKQGAAETPAPIADPTAVHRNPADLDDSHHVRNDRETGGAAAKRSAQGAKPYTGEQEAYANSSIKDPRDPSERQKGTDADPGSTLGTGPVHSRRSSA